MVVAKSEHAYTRAQAGVQGARGRQALPRRRARATPTRARHDRRPDRPAPHATTTGSRCVAGGRPSVTHYDTLEAFPAASPARRPAGDRPHPPDPGALRPPCATRASATSPTAPTRRSPPRLGLTRQWLHARALGFAHPADGRWVEFVSPYPGRSRRRAGSAARVTTRGRLALLAACGVVGGAGRALHGRPLARAHAGPAPGVGAARAGAGRGRRRLPAAGRGHPAAAGHHGARARAVRRRADRRRRGRPRARPPRRCSASTCRGCRPRCASSRSSRARRPPSTPRGSGPRAPPRPTRAGSRAAPAAVATAEAAALTRPDCPCLVALVVTADGAALRRPGAGVRVIEAAPQGVTLRELALSPLLPEQADRADPLPDDGPVP